SAPQASPISCAPRSPGERDRPMANTAPPAAGEGDRIAVAFAQVLRGAGLDVPVGSVVSFAQALGALGVCRQRPVYWAGRATLVTRPEDVPGYDRVFAALWLGEG